MQTLSLVIAILALVVGVLAHFAPLTKNTIDDKLAAFGAKLLADLRDVMSKLGPPAAMLAVFVGVALFTAQLGACSARARHETIAVTFAAVQTAADTFVAYDERHQAAITDDTTTSTADRAAKLAAYRAKRAKFAADIKAAFDAVTLAIRLDDDHSLASLLAAAQVVADELHTLGVTP